LSITHSVRPKSPDMIARRSKWSLEKFRHQALKLRPHDNDFAKWSAIQSQWPVADDQPAVNHF
jgi:hypothetical protein